jgi:hypothetical protein
MQGSASLAMCIPINEALFSPQSIGRVFCAKCYTRAMYARKLQVDVIVGDARKPCPLDWLDAFCMRNFTGSAEFDDTLPVGDGQLEASLRVEPSRFAAAFGEWLTKRGKGNGQPVRVEIREN